MIDFHSHLLPGIDDGSRNVEETIKMLYEQHQQGVQKIVATPHFYASRDSVEHFLKCRTESLSMVQKAISGEKWKPELYAGAEVYYFPDIGDAETISKLCVEGTSVFLLELPFCQWNRSILKDVKKLIDGQRLTVVLAHVERYYEFQKNKEIWDKIMELPLYLQMNAGSFMNWKKRRLAFRILNERGAILLGSDCHNMENRPPNLADGRDAIRKKLGGGFLKEIDDLGERIWQL